MNILIIIIIIILIIMNTIILLLLLKNRTQFVTILGKVKEKKKTNYDGVKKKKVK